MDSVDSGLRWIFRSGFRRGFRGQSLWFVIGSAAWMLYRARRNHSEVVYRTVLRAGEALVVSTAPADGD